jgi:hypothetical protein
MEKETGGNQQRNTSRVGVTCERFDKDNQGTYSERGSGRFLRKPGNRLPKCGFTSWKNSIFFRKLLVA